MQLRKKSSFSKRNWFFSTLDETELRQLARLLGEVLDAGDSLALYGDVGAGKTSFARAIIHAKIGAPVNVPSPTFTLVQHYDWPLGTLAHFDLYRLTTPDELDELGWAEMIDGAISLIEWPQQAGHLLPKDRLDVSIDFTTADERRNVTLIGRGKWRDKLDSVYMVDQFLSRAGWPSARRELLHGDASGRSYQRLYLDGNRAILMHAGPIGPDGVATEIARGGSAEAPNEDGNSSSDGDGTPNGDTKTFAQPGRPYAGHVQDVIAFLAIADGLRKQQIPAPEIFAYDSANGLVLMEDLGDETLVEDGVPVAERYGAAVDLLVAMHQRTWPNDIVLADGIRYKLPRYDMNSLRRELSLLLDWYAPTVSSLTPDGAAAAEFHQLWQQLLQPICAMRDDQLTWVLRDYHSPNILWLGQKDARRQGNEQKLGVIDFQDAVVGHPAYDVVSLVQDARIDVPEAMEQALLERYRRAQADLDWSAFIYAYALLGAQRNSKILGIFTRLAQRDRKPSYLVHMPRIRKYLRRNLMHPNLTSLQLWYQTHLPAALTEE